MKDRLKNTKKHLKSQIEKAKQMDSQFVYILVSEAEKCLELAEVEETLVAQPVQAEIEGSDRSWWYVCGECHTALNPHDKYCHECGRKVKWE